MQAHLHRDITAFLLVVAGLGVAGCFDDEVSKAPLAPESVIAAEANLDNSCATPNYTPSRAEVRRRRQDVALLIRALRRNPDTRYRYDDSDPDPQTLRDLLSQDVSGMRRGACAEHSVTLGRALRSLPSSSR